jgi:uncharacterized 2Fe-2S/4Fe-4S cluster protein (DUF4445 family)
MTATAKPKKHLVIFQPSGSRGYVEDGTPLLEAARELGVAIESPCGGRMMCSKCRVRIEEGFFERFGVHSSMDHLNPVQEKEKAFFREKGLEGDNYRQSCVAKVHGDVVVYVPEESRAVKQIVRKSARELSIEIKPAVRRYFVELSPATLHEPLGDWERLQAALQSEHGLTDLSIDYLVLRRLQKVIREGDWKVTVSVWQDHEVIQVEPGYAEIGLGLAVDVGTTTVAAYLCDLDDGTILATAAMMNPQTPYGDDVMARITYAMTNEDGLETLHTAILNGLNDIVQQVCEESGYAPDQILEAVLVGNTCMDHIFLNIYPKYVGVSPFTPAVHHSVNVKARDFGLNILPSGNVHVLPNQAGFVGADNTAVIIAEEPHKQDDMMLIIDIGTNGEIVMGNRRKLISASVPTGPAFEGAEIAFGMRAAEGAIERIKIDPVTWDVIYRVIGKDKWSHEMAPEEIGARGICGSAIIEIGWEMYKAGVINASGRFSRETHHPRLRQGPKGTEFVLAWAPETAIGRDITFSVDDVRALQLAKSAMYSAARLMMRRLGIEKVDKIVLAGAFGSYIDKVKAMAMGLIPDCELKNVYAVGNAAGDGARIALLNTEKRREADEVADQVEYIELTVEPDFEKEFAAAMHFPHMRDRFPHLEPMFEKMRHQRNLRLLKNTAFFADLPDPLLERVAKTVTEQKVRKRKPIFKQGSDPQAFWIVKEGAVKITVSRDGRKETTLAELGPGEFLGEMAILEGRPHSATATANALNTILLRIGRDDFQQLLREAPDFALKITRVLSERLHQTDELLVAKEAE